MSENFYTVSQAADILSVSKATLRRWDGSGKLIAIRVKNNNYRVYSKKQLTNFEEAQLLFENKSETKSAIKALKRYTTIELFSGAGGLALGLEKAGFKPILLNDIDENACSTLLENRPNWNVVKGDIANIDFIQYRNKVDLLAGGFPCQAFSYAGKKLGFKDKRGTLVFEYARAIEEIQPKIVLCENVRGLLTHNDGKTVKAISKTIKDLGYHLIEPRVLKAIFFKVPQKRERLFLIGIRKDIAPYLDFQWPSPCDKIMTIKDALKPGELYTSRVPDSPGQQYPEHKKKVLDLVPPGGCWRDLPIKIQKKYMMKSYYLGGGKTGMARRLSWDEPSLTLTCSPAQKQTERCHPDTTRPLTIREYARIQTFPDSWEFCGSISSQYKQIGNAVPINLGYAVATALINILNQAKKAGFN